MRKPFSLFAAGALILSSIALAGPASAHDDRAHEAIAHLAGETHIPTGSPGAGSHSQNMKFQSTIGPTGFTNSDIAFQGRFAYAGNYGGFRVVDISDSENPVVVANVSCFGPQNDTSVYGSILIVSVDTPLTSPACGSPAASPNTLETAWEGIRIFDVSNPASPAFLTAVYTKCGSHTNTLIPDLDDNRLLVYVASYPLRSGPDCGPYDDLSDTHNPLHEQISIVQIPIGNPAAASLLSEPAIDVPTWDIRDQIGPNPAFNAMRGCHDLQANLELGLMAAACAGVGQLWDISDPANPGTANPIWEVDRPEIDLYHSALFSEEGDTVIFGDEIIAGTCSTLADGDGQMWFHNRANGALLSSFQISRDQGGDYCSSHLFNNIPGVRGDVLVAAWYAGGTIVVDYTNRASPKEIGFYDPSGGSTWASYWYNNFIYSNDIPLGFNILKLSGPARAGADRLPTPHPQVP